jgi:hypothetical protein
LAALLLSLLGCLVRSRYGRRAWWRGYCEHDFKSMCLRMSSKSSRKAV